MKVRIGFEIHQQLATRKLFCNCESKLIDREPDFIIVRRLKPVQSELGEIDRAALEEYLKGRVYVYEGFYENTCLVELDEEPPHMPNQEAIDIAIEVALLLNATIVDEIHFMRKIVIDGSNVSGFQRTAIIGLDGYIETEYGKVKIPTICLEEEAARKIREEDNRVIYRLDRLGIPLIEISTAPDIKSPEEALEVALRIGDILRSTGKVRRGIGTIRQDINISIDNNPRIEIKGVQELDLIPQVIKYEIERQKKLLEIKEELSKRIKKEELKFEIYDLSNIFKNTKCKILKSSLNRGEAILGLKLKGFSGLLGKPSDRVRFGKELADYVRVKTGVKGIFHSDELPNYGISEEEVLKVREYMKLNENDAFVIVAAKYDKAKDALEVVFDRCLKAFDGIIEETRAARDDGTTVYMRPLPTAARMYPETDIPPIKITKERIERIRKSLPELIDKRIERYIKQYNLSEELAKKIARSEYYDFFEKIVNRYKLSPKIVAWALTDVYKELKREGIILDEKKYEEMFSLLKEGKISKEAIPDFLRGKFKVEEISIEDLRKRIIEVINERRDYVLSQGLRAVKGLMGIIMKEFRGKIDGKIVYKTLEEEVRRFLDENR